MITLDITLYIVEQHEIGLYSLILAGFSTLDIRVTVVQLIGWNILPVSKKFRTACVISFPAIGHALMKNRAFNLSCPGALGH